MLYFLNEGTTIKDMAQVTKWKMPRLDKNIIKTLNLLKWIIVWLHKRILLLKNELYTGVKCRHICDLFSNGSENRLCVCV